MPLCDAASIVLAAGSSDLRRFLDRASVRQLMNLDPGENAARGEYSGVAARNAAGAVGNFRIGKAWRSRRGRHGVYSAYSLAQE